MAVSRIICPVCGESSDQVPGSAVQVACPRCGSSFAEHEATIVDSAVASRCFLDSARLTERMPSVSGPVSGLPEIPGYEVLDFVARGGMGMVLKAHHVALSRLVAIKMPLPHDALDAASRDRFLREARAAAHLRHPNICPIHEVGEVGGRPFIAMAFIAGDTLRDWAKRERPSPRRAAEVVAAVARAVGYAHEHGIIHRDIKPGNVLVDAETGQPILTDFGLAKVISEDAPGVTVTVSGDIIGTPAYMAPEQAAGHTGQIGPLSDIYGLGAVLYELLCGRPPFLGTKMEILVRVQTEEPASPRKLNPRIHRDLETICLKTLSKDPAARYASAVALAEDLERFGAGEPIAARRQGWASRLARKVRRNPFVFAALGVAALAILAGVYFASMAGHTRRAATLSQAFESGLDAQDWTPEQIESLEGILAEWSRLAPRQAATARQRLHQRFADTIAEAIRRPTLGTDDVAAIEESLKALATRDSQSAAELRRSLQQRLRLWQPVFALEAPFGDLASVLDPALVRVEANALLVRTSPGAAASSVRTRIPCGVNVQVEAAFDASWESASEVGLLINATEKDAYSFLLRPLRAAEEKAGGKTLSFAARRAEGGRVRLEIRRKGAPLQEQSLAASQIVSGRLRLLASREGDRLTFQVNDLPPVTFEDVFPIRGTESGVYGLLWPGGVRLLRLQGRSQTLPAAPSPLERGDDLTARGQFEEAIGSYREQAIAAKDKETTQAARYKEGLCLVAMKREDEAAQVFEPLAAQPGRRWPVLAACQLWAIRLGQDRLADAEAIFEGLSTRHKFEKLAVQIPVELRDRIVNKYVQDARLLDFILRPNPNKLRDMERAIAVQELCGAHVEGAKRYLLRGYCSAGKMDEAVQLAEAILRADPNHLLACEDYGWTMRLKGNPRRALEAVDRLLLDPAGGYREAYRTLLVERARVHAALEEWDAAEKDVDDYCRLADARSSDYHHYSGAALIKGFLRERRGDSEGAIAAWRRGLAKVFFADRAGSRPGDAFALAGTGSGLLHAGVLASLTGDLTDAEAAALAACILAQHQADSPIRALSDVFHFPPAALRAAWQSPRGRELARTIAFQSVPPGEMVLATGGLLFTEMARQGAFIGATSPEQDALLWKLFEDGLDAFVNRRLSLPQLIQIGLTWKGTTNFLGWAGVAPGLDPALRGPLAYVLGHRYLRLSRPADAATFFRTALADAPPDSPLRRLAQAELERLKAK